MSVIQQTIEVDIEAIKADHQEALTTVSASAADLRAAAKKKFMQNSVHVECPVATHAQDCSNLGDVGEQDIETLEADHREARKKYETALEAKKLAVEAQKLAVEKRLLAKGAKDSCPGLTGSWKQAIKEERETIAATKRAKEKLEN